MVNFLNEASCANKNCKNYHEYLSFDLFDRCPLCFGPFALSDDLPFVLNGTFGDMENANLLTRYFSKEFLDLFQDKLDLFIDLALKVGNTKLEKNISLNKNLELPNLYLKEEGSNNVSQSFKDRGSLLAIMCLFLKITLNEKLIIGTVSLGNMAISTVYLIDYLKHFYPDTFGTLQSYVVINKNLEKIRLQAIKHAGALKGTDIFEIDGQYALFHESVYSATRSLRQNGVQIYAQLTDDLFRLIGYTTLAYEILEQMVQKTKDVPDFILIPSASGACFRALVYAIDRFKRLGVIQRKPKVVLVQEQMADPIVQSFLAKQTVCKEISMTSSSQAPAIAVSRSRSGTSCLQILNENEHICISVSGEEIIQDYELAKTCGIFYETGSISSISAARKLRKQGVIHPNDTVVAILTGLDEPYRDLMKKPLKTSSSLLSGTADELQALIINTYIQS